MFPLLHFGYLEFWFISTKHLYLENVSYIKKQQEQVEAQTKYYHQSNQQWKPVLTFSYVKTSSKVQHSLKISSREHVSFSKKLGNLAFFESTQSYRFLRTKSQIQEYFDTPCPRDCGYQI